MVRSADNTARGFLAKKNSLAAGLDAIGSNDLNIKNKSEEK